MIKDVKQTSTINSGTNLYQLLSVLSKFSRMQGEVVSVSVALIIEIGQFICCCFSILPGNIRKPKGFQMFFRGYRKTTANQLTGFFLRATLTLNG